jgi:hypothetical protein
MVKKREVRCHRVQHSTLKGHTTLIKMLTILASM